MHPQNGHIQLPGCKMWSTHCLPLPQGKLLRCCMSENETSVQAHTHPQHKTAQLDTAQNFCPRHRHWPNGKQPASVFTEVVLAQPAARALNPGTCTVMICLWHSNTAADNAAGPDTAKGSEPLPSSPRRSPPSSSCCCLTKLSCTALQPQTPAAHALIGGHAPATRCVQHMSSSCKELSAASAAVGGWTAKALSHAVGPQQPTTGQA
ncbi:hypothetical protein COO60DRAFT_803018 [Scenedesmus sp. NREL 46B-D3]|nr:hypothetical protein COO60DRAFT_803018 [Scenedesmus sp. NREL 46B-D3]